MPKLQVPPPKCKDNFYPWHPKHPLLVGLICVDKLALGAAIGKSTFSRTFLNNGCAGDLTATVFSPAVTEFGIISFLGKIKVSGPGQKRRQGFYLNCLCGKNQMQIHDLAHEQSENCGLPLIL